jgi:4-amino-4-deoxy-L-arabinose transferase-like glycosyltransferase
LSERQVRRERLYHLLVLIFAAALFTFRLGAGSLWDVDEPRYAEAGRELAAAGDLLTPHLNGAVWLGPAPLWIWLEAASGRVFGFSEWPARVWSAAFGVAGVAAVSALGREWFGPRTGLLSGLVVATMLAYAVTARLAVVDLAAVTWMLLAAWAGYRAYRAQEPRARRRAFLLAAVFLGLGVLTRGPGTLVVPVTTMVAFLTYRRLLGRLRDMPWAAALLIFLAIAAPWYAIETLRFGAGFLRDAVWGHAASRLAAAPGAHAGLLLTDAGIVAIGAAPWTAFLPAAAGYHYFQRWQDGSLLCLVWGALVVLLAVTVGDGLPGDVTALFPIAAIAVARLWEEFLFEGAGRLGRMLRASFALQIGVVVLLVVAAATFATSRYPREFAAVRDFLLAPVGVLVLGTGVATVLFRARRYAAAFLSLPATTAVFLGIIYTGTLPAVETQKPIRPIAASLRSQLRPGDRVITYMMPSPAGLVFYARHYVRPAADAASLGRLICEPGRAFVVARRDDLAAAGTLPGALRPVAADGAYVVEEKPEAAGCGQAP